MKNLSLTKFYYLFLSLALFCFCACDKESNSTTEEAPVVSANDLTVPTDFSEYQAIEAIFGHLAKQEHLLNMSMSDQFVSMNLFAQYKGIPFNFEETIENYEASAEAVLRGEISEHIVQAEVDVSDLIHEHGFTADLQKQLELYRLNLVDHEAAMGEETVAAIASYVRLMEFLATSPNFGKYASRRLGIELGALPRTGFICCAAAQLALAAALAACAANPPIGCLGVPSAILNVDRNCRPRGGEPVNPCENSPNPCCGVHCASGYYCNQNGNCVVDPNDPGCINNPCPPGFSCAQNQCIPH